MSVKSPNPVKGTIFNIQRMSVHDGDGIRTTVFFKGCPLDCLWCSNPESQKTGLEIATMVNRCTNCGYCAKACQKGLIAETEGYPLIDDGSCDQCMACVDECCMAAKKIVGQEYDVDELYAEIIKDKPFFDSSGGGVTFSGGEPLMQSDFLLAVLKKCKAEGLHTAIETTGLARAETLRSILPYVDQIFIDVKHMNSERHQELTAVSNKEILSNLAVVAEYGGNITVRIPVIPTLNADVNNIRATADYVAGLGIPKLELLPYHNYGESKYRQIGREYQLKGIEPPKEKEMAALVEEAKAIIGERGTSVWSA